VDGRGAVSGLEFARPFDGHSIDSPRTVLAVKHHLVVQSLAGVVGVAQAFFKVA